MLNHEAINSLLAKIENLSDYERNILFLKYAGDVANSKTATEILKEYQKKSNFFFCSSIPLNYSLNSMLDFSKIVSANNYDFIELSPIAPLGINTVITKLSQNLVASAFRGFEIIADPATMLILEASNRRKKYRAKRMKNPVDLATCCRLLRMQKYTNDKFLQHFSALALGSVFYTTSSSRDKIAKIIQHVSVYLDYMLEQNKKKYSFRNIEVAFCHMSILDIIISYMTKEQQERFRKSTLDDDYFTLDEFNIERIPAICSENELYHLDRLGDIFDLKQIKQYFFIILKYLIMPLNKKYPNVKFSFDINRKTGHGYYKNYCFYIYADNMLNKRFMLGDGGEVDWAGQFLSDNNEAAVSSGFGLEMAHVNFINQ